MGIQLVRRAGMTLDLQQVPGVFGSHVVRLMRARLARGEDADGKKFAQRSSVYADQLQAIGVKADRQSTFKLSGATSASLAMIRTKQKMAAKGGTQTPVRVDMYFGATKGSRSPYIARPPWWLFIRTKSADERMKGLVAWRRSRKKRRRSPRCTDLLYWNAMGTSIRRSQSIGGGSSISSLTRGFKRPARFALGLSSTEEAELWSVLSPLQIIRAT